MLMLRILIKAGFALLAFVMFCRYGTTRREVK